MSLHSEDKLGLSVWGWWHFSKISWLPSSSSLPSTCVWRNQNGFGFAQMKSLIRLETRRENSTTSICLVDLKTSWRPNVFVRLLTFVIAFTFVKDQHKHVQFTNRKVLHNKIFKLDSDCIPSIHRAIYVYSEIIVCAIIYYMMIISLNIFVRWSLCGHPGSGDFLFNCITCSLHCNLHAYKFG